MFHFLGRVAADHPRIILAVWLLLAVALKIPAPDWQKNATDDDVGFMPADSPGVRGHRLMAEAFPADVAASRAVVTFERADGGILREDDWPRVDRCISSLRKLQKERSDLGITQVGSYREGPVGSRLVADDKSCVLVPINLDSPQLTNRTRDALNEVEKRLEASTDTGALKYAISGAAGVGRDLVNAGGKSLDRTTWATIGLVIVVLLGVYRSPLLALVPLVTIGLAVWVSLQLLALLTLIPGIRLVGISQVFAVVILFGAGTDYCLFLISRYREELELGAHPAGGLPRAVRAVTGAIVGSAGTVICGLGMMGFAEFGKIRCAGPVIAIGLIVGLLAALTVTPALLALGGRTLFWPRRVRLLPPEKLAKTFWHRASRLVVERPGQVFAVALAILLPLALLGTRIQPSFRPTGDLGPDAQSVLGMKIIQEHFTAGEVGPITVLLAGGTDWTAPAGRDLIAQLSANFANLPNVAEVRSLAQPLGKPENPSANADTLKGMLQARLQNAERAIAAGHYVSQVGGESVTRLDVVLKDDPFEPSSIRSLALIELWLKDLLPAQSADGPTLRAECFGVTVNARDMADVIRRDRAVVNSLVVAGVFLILLILVKRLWLASYLLATVLLSYFATLGATAIFGMWLTGKPFGVLEWRVPFFLFTILVAIGEDYNILLVTRILEERKRHGLVEGVRRGLAMTGGTITACGAIMAGTFGTLILADLSTLKQVGFALAFGVALDTLVVRPFLVPAFMLLVWKEADPIRVRRSKWNLRYVSEDAVSVKRAA